MLEDSILEQHRRRMVSLLMSLTPAEGMQASALDGVRVSRSNHSHPRSPVLYDPSIYILASGRKKGYVGDREFVYDRNNYLVLSVPLPFECELEIAEGGEPLLGMSVRVDLGLVSELAVRMELNKRDDSSDCLSIIATPLDESMSSAAVRLLECLSSPVEASILGPGIVREIVYRVLCGPQGNALLAMLGRNGQLTQIHSVLRRMHQHYSKPLNVPRMAEEAGMSVSAFHHAFKTVTSTSPVQYLKAIRLHKARLLMMHDGLGAALAADRVGYESASQFSREFKRFFGASPMQDSMRARELADAQGRQSVSAASA
jgi:AraC-like DNA-binding protein